MSAPASFSSSSFSFSYGWTYDVFLSFRGQDTRHGFTGYLYNALLQKGIHTFIDDEHLQRGDQITPSLVKAIQESRIAIIVLSKTYASSSFCLDELAYILDCINHKGRLVLPVFYDVDPSDVRHLRGSFGEAFAMHEHKFKADKEKFNYNMEKLEKWKLALHHAANLSGYHFKHGDGYEYEFIGRIIEEVSSKINRAALHVAHYPVGLESRVLQVLSLLDVGSDDGVHMVGIYGIGGIGKTTVARAVYNLIADQFEGLCFLDDVRENSIKHGSVHLQEKLLSEIVGEKDIELGSVNKGIPIIKHRLHRKKVLLVLDDVDKLEQLRAIVGGPDWFGSGSRVIITTRDKHLLASHGIDRKYEVDDLNEKEALELLSWNAFNYDKVDPSYKDILNQAVTYASGLPLALEVIGSNLFGKRLKEWESALAGYQRIPIEEIQKILQVSFDALDEVEKNIFLDIACFFKGYKLVDVKEILYAHHGVCLEYGIGVLIEKSLVKIRENGAVTLHDLIEDMAKEIVRQESPKEPGKRSRLWFPKDIVQVFEQNTGTSKIQIIILDFPLSEEEEVVEWDGEAFKKMINLKTLIIRNGCFSEGPKHLPHSLRVLEWWRYPSQSLPSDFHLQELAIFKLPLNCLMSLELPKMQKKFMNLRFLDFEECECITQIPDVSGVPNLEELSFGFCQNLIKIHESVGFLDKLRILDAHGCSKLSSFPPIKLTSLEELYLSYCDSLESFPEILGKMENITQLSLEETPFKELPFSIRNLTRLRKLELQYCGMLQLSSSIVMLPELDELSIGECEGLRSPKQEEGEGKMTSMMPSNTEHLSLSCCNISDEFLRIGLTWFANVRELDLSWSKFTILPASIKECHFLRSLDLDFCELLQEIRGIPPNLETFTAKDCTSLKYLDLSLLPACINECFFLREIILDSCENLQEIRGIPPNIELLSAIDCTSFTSWCTSMLLSQELHKAGNKNFVLPGTRIPDWFEHCSKGRSISFWFRNEFPAISLCVVTGEVDIKYCKQFRLKFIINGCRMSLIDKGCCSFFPVVHNHVFIIGEKQIKFGDDVEGVLLENEWNHVVFSIDFLRRANLMDPFVKIGLHVFKQKSRMEDIQFSNPYKRGKLDDYLITIESENHLSLKEKHISVDMGVSQIEFMQQQQNLASLALLEPHMSREWLSLLQPPSLNSSNDNVNWDSNSTVSMRISSTTNVRGCEIVSRKRKIGTLSLNNEASEPFCQEPSEVFSDSNSATSSLASDTTSQGGKHSGCGVASRKRRKGTLSLDLDNEASEPFCYATSNVVLDSDSKMSSSANGTASDGGFATVSKHKGKDLLEYNDGSKPLSMRPCWQEPLDYINWDSKSMKSTYTSDTISDQDTNSSKVCLVPFTETQEEPLVTSIHSKELMLPKKGKLKENGNLGQESNAMISTSRNRGRQQGDKITSGEQIHQIFGSLTILA